MVVLGYFILVNWIVVFIPLSIKYDLYGLLGWIELSFGIDRKGNEKKKKGKTPISVTTRSQPMFWTSNVRTFEHSNPGSSGPKGRGIERSNVPHEHSNVRVYSPLSQNPETLNVRTFSALGQFMTLFNWFGSISFWNYGIVYGTSYGFNNLNYPLGPHIRTVFGRMVSYRRRIQIPSMILMNSSEKGSIHMKIIH